MKARHCEDKMGNIVCDYNETQNRILFVLSSGTDGKKIVLWQIEWGVWSTAILSVIILQMRQSELKWQEETTLQYMLQQRL